MRLGQLSWIVPTYCCQTSDFTHLDCQRIMTKCQRRKVWSEKCLVGGEIPWSRNCTSFSVALTLLLVLGGCIQSSHDIAMDNLQPLLPLTPGTYNEGPDNTAYVMINGDGYMIQEKSKRPTRNGKFKIIADTHQVRFFKIPELPRGYIVQKNVENVRFCILFCQGHGRLDSYHHQLP